MLCEFCLKLSPPFLFGGLLLSSLRFCCCLSLGQCTQPCCLFLLPPSSCFCLGLGCLPAPLSLHVRFRHGAAFQGALLSFLCQSFPGLLLTLARLGSILLLSLAILFCLLAAGSSRLCLGSRALNELACDMTLIHNDLAITYISVIEVLGSSGHGASILQNHQGGRAEVWIRNEAHSRSTSEHNEEKPDLLLAPRCWKASDHQAGLLLLWYNKLRNRSACRRWRFARHSRSCCIGRRRAGCTLLCRAAACISG
mmetsp:Transcript_6914/g.15131  ORF Transcript_6914/g.15131 Transcript_6914/m.15131 type:complete len:253 (-) Transcript_6914:472-1230(-)